MENKIKGILKNSLVAAVSCAATVTGFANEEQPITEIAAVGIRNSTPFCAQVSAIAIGSEHTVAFGTTPDQFLGSNATFGPKGNFEKAYLTSLTLYEVSDNKDCTDPTPIAQYKFKNPQDICKISTTGVSGGLVDATSSRYVIDINYKMLKRNDGDGNSFVEGVLTCVDGVASKYHSSGTDEDLVEGM